MLDAARSRYIESNSPVMPHLHTLVARCFRTRRGARSGRQAVENLAAVKQRVATDESSLTGASFASSRTWL